MMEFELESEWGGWDHISIPDDMEVLLRTSNTEHSMQISLASLLELYGYVVHRQSCDMVVGTGDIIEISLEDNHIRFRKPPLDIRTTFDELEITLESLIQEAFKEKSAESDMESRTEAIRSVQKRIEEKDIGYNIEELYAKLVEE